MLIEQISRYKFDLDEARKAANAILYEYETNQGQLSLTHRPGVNEHDKLYQATGSLYNYDKSELKFKESEFTVFNDRFKDTYLYKMYQSIPDVGRFRIMVMDGPKCYTIHNDFTRRYHLVLYTDPRCYFVFPEDNELVHVPCDGELYRLDTTKQHTFLNGSRERRIHLVLDDLSTY